MPVHMVDSVNRTTSTDDAQLEMHMVDPVSRIVANAETQTSVLQNQHANAVDELSMRLKRNAQPEPQCTMPTTGLSIWLQNDEHDYAQNALNTVYTIHTSHASPLKRTSNAVLKYQMSDHVKKGPLDLCWIICPSIERRINPSSYT
jgi:hypothetical protein